MNTIASAMKHLGAAALVLAAGADSAGCSLLLPAVTSATTRSIDTNGFCMIKIWLN